MKNDIERVNRNGTTAVEPTRQAVTCMSVQLTIPTPELSTLLCEVVAVAV